MRFDVEGEGFDGTRLWLRAMRRNSRNLYPLANKGLQRWRESEARTFAERAGWEPRKPSTIKRYERPIKNFSGKRMGRAKGRGPGFYSGRLHRGLTKPHQKGIKDRVAIGGGRVTLDVGIKGGRQPLAYGNWQGSGDRGARPGLVSFDHIAAADLAADTREHIVPGRRRVTR